MYVLLYQLDKRLYWNIMTKPLEEINKHLCRYPLHKKRVIIVPLQNITNIFHTRRIIPTQYVYKRQCSSLMSYYVCENENIVYSLLTDIQKNDKIIHVQTNETVSDANWNLQNF